LNIVHMVAEFHRSDLKHYKVLFLSTHVIAMSSTIYNPFLYSWLNDNFRKEFQEILPCLFTFCTCFTHDRFNNRHLPDGEICHDRPSNNHLLIDSANHGLGNGWSPKKVHHETMPLKSIQSNVLLPDSTLISNQPSTRINVNSIDL
jgi:hypothetical protein